MFLFPIFHKIILIDDAYFYKIYHYTELLRTTE
jgi:hypothetical protein